MLHGPAFSRPSMPTSCVDHVNPVKLGSSKGDDNRVTCCIAAKGRHDLGSHDHPILAQLPRKSYGALHGQQRARNGALSPGSRAARGNTLLRKLLPNARAGAGAFKRHGPARQVRSRRLLQPRHARGTSGKRSIRCAYGGGSDCPVEVIAAACCQHEIAWLQGCSTCLQWATLLLDNGDRRIGSRRGAGRSFAVEPAVVQASLLR